MNHHKLVFLFLISGLLISGCFTMPGQYNSVPPGTWRAVLALHPGDLPVQTGKRSKDKIVQSIEEVTEGELPFNFDIVYETESKFYIEISNGPERIRVDDIKTWHDRPTNNDSILINFPVYGTFIKAAFE
jgi:hypothetical protein